MARTAQVNYEGRPSVLRGQTSQVPVELFLPEAHPKQGELINAFDARLDPERPQLGAVFDSRHPNFYDLPLAYPDLRFIVGACGTKFGKTYGCSIRIVKEAWDKAGSLNWWVAPSYKQSEMAYRLCKRLLPKDTYQDYKADLRLELIEPDGNWHSTIEFKSADNDDNLRGFAVNFFILDEAARISREAYDSVLTTTTQTDGRGIIISTPKGRNWFFDEYQRGDKGTLLDGETDEYPEYMSIRMPTWTNPTVKPQRILMMRKNMPADVFEQEVAARFMLDGAGVFRGIENCIKNVLVDHMGRPLWETPVSGHRYVLGVDLARKKDYTVIFVLDRKRRHVVYYDRFNDLSWAVQKRRIVDTAKRYNNAAIWMDGTGLGDPIVEDVRNAGCHVECFIISTRSKQDLIESLRASIEFGRITFPTIPVLIRELKSFEYAVTTSGNIKYSAPSGQHDDTVLALALANKGVAQRPLIYKASQVRGA
jgi:hypothetical protein